MAWPLPELSEARLAAASLEELLPDKRGAPRRNKRKRFDPPDANRRCMKPTLLAAGDDSQMATQVMHDNDEPLQDYELIDDEDPWGDQERWELD